MTSLASVNEHQSWITASFWHLLPVNSSFLNINNNITDGSAEIKIKKKEGLALILLDEKSLPGWYTCGDLIWLFFKHSEREAKNLFHLRAIKWIPESLAPARRRGLFFPPWFYYPFPLPCASRRNAHFSLTKPHFQRQNHTGTTMIKCKPVLP